jgi:hypothetical protein
MKTTSILPCFFFLAACFTARAQAVPEATGPGGSPTGNERTQYALRYSQTGQFSSTISNSQSSTLSGSAGYANQNEHLPFSLNYAGGFAWTLTGTPYNSGQFHRLYLSQGIDSHKWKILLSDDVSYLPQSPTTGFSGIPGIGEPIGGTSPAPPSSSQSILAFNTHAINNQGNGELTYDVNSATSFSAGGGPGLLRFPNNDGLDTDWLSANGKFVRHFNARNSLTGDYQFSRYTYPGNTVTFVTNTAQAGYRRLWTRNVTTDISAGPAWIGSSTTAVPSSTTVSATASVTYLLRFASASLSYLRGINGGAGYLIGGKYDTVSGNLAKNFGTNFTTGLSGGLERTTGLNGNGTTNATFGGAEATYHIGQRIIVFANYTASSQTSTSALPTNALNQMLQIVGFGVGYSPRESQRKR